MEPLAIQKAVQFEYENPTDFQPLVNGDPNRTAQVLDNLLSNALRYAPRDSKIMLSLENLGGQIQCSVSDRGPGISREHLPLIFERFYRVDKSRNRESGGSGLGLAIARALIEAQDGSIQAHSIIGERTTITFQLPSEKLARN